MWKRGRFMKVKNGFILRKVGRQYVVAATGLVREREAKTNKIATGDIEIYVTELRLLAKAETPPFEIVENSKANDMLRLKYRYLDLRRPDMLSKADLSKGDIEYLRQLKKSLKGEENE